MNRAFFGALSRVLSAVACICIGIYIGHSNELLPKKHSLQWKIDELKVGIAKSEIAHEASRTVVYLIPPYARDSTELCLLKAYASPIKLLDNHHSQVRADTCHMEKAALGYLRVTCPYSARELAKSCAAQLR